MYQALAMWAPRGWPRHSLRVSTSSAATASDRYFGRVVYAAETSLRPSSPTAQKIASARLQK